MKRLISNDYGASAPFPAAIAEPRTIAFALKTVTNDDFRRPSRFHPGCGRSQTVSLGHRWWGRVSIQVNQVEDLIAKGRRHHSQPHGRQGGGACPEEGSGRQHPGCVVDSLGGEGQRGLYISYVGTDNFNAGKTPASVWSGVGRQGNVLIVRGAKWQSSRRPARSTASRRASGQRPALW